MNGHRAVKSSSRAARPSRAGDASPNGYDTYGEPCNCRCSCCSAGLQLDMLPLPYMTFAPSLKLVYANSHARAVFGRIPANATAAHFFCKPANNSSVDGTDQNGNGLAERLSVLKAQMIGIADEQLARPGWGSGSLLNYFVGDKVYRCMVAINHTPASRYDGSGGSGETRPSTPATYGADRSPTAGGSSSVRSLGSANSSSMPKRPRSPPQSGVTFSVTFLSLFPQPEDEFHERAQYFFQQSTLSPNVFEKTSPAKEQQQLVAPASHETSSDHMQVDVDKAEAIALASLVGQMPTYTSISEILQCEEMARMLDELPQIVWVARQDGQIVFLNKRWYEFTGVSLQELQDPSRWLTLFHPEDIKAALETYAKACADSQPIKMQYRVKGKDGSWRWMYANGKPLFDPEGKPWRNVAVLSDVEELVQVKSQAERLRKHISAVLACSEMFVVTIDMNSNVTLLEGPSPNDTWIPGRTHLCIGQPIQSILPSKTLDDAVRKLLDENLDSLVLRTGPDVESCEQAGQRHIRFRIVPLREQGSTTGVIIVGSDVSRLVEAEDALEKSAAERVALEATARAAREASRLKTAFTTTMSHEIRSPIAGMIGVFELLLADSRLPPSAHVLVEKGLQTGELLLDIVGRVLDFGKIEAGKLEIETKPFKLSELVADTSVFSMQAEKRGLEFKQDIGPYFAGPVRGDRIRVRQVLFNGLSNAIKFTKHGNITLKMTQQAESAFQVLIHFEITDSGVGIEKSVLPTLFTPFKQADTSTARRFGGSGLGLAISRDLVKLMGGTISLTSEIGKGSILSVHLPFEKELDAWAGSLPNPPRSPTSPTMSNASLPALSSSSVHSSVEGAMSSSIPDTPPAVAAALGHKSSYLDHHHHPAPAATNGDSMACSPPLRPTLATRVSSSILLPRVSHKQMVSPKAKPSQVKILVAEDNELLREIVTRTLQKMEFEVESVENGAEAVEAAATGKFDLLLCDGMMPTMDGYEACARIRRHPDPAVSSIKIIALTANAVKGDRERCLDAGMDSYLSKPVRAKDLEAAIWTQLGLEGVPPLSQ